MSRQPKNEAFARTSFLQGANAAYIEEMQAQYERNPGVGERRVAALLRQPPGGAAATATATTGRPGPGRWSRSAGGDRELLGALTGDYGDAERTMRDKIAGARRAPAASS